jgi:osmotically-inducible protein OsmY
LHSELISYRKQFLAIQRDLSNFFMKNSLLYSSLLVGLFLGAAAVAAPAPSAGVSVGAGVSANRAVGPASPVVPPGTVPPATVPPGTVSPVLPPRTMPPSKPTLGASSNNPGAFNTNEMGAATNGFQGSNNLASTNFIQSGTNVNGNFVLRDQAVTPSDRVLLTALIQGVDLQLGITVPAARPVHFFINSGAVTIVGTVTTADQSQRILARVQQTPGVLSVFNDLHVGSSIPTVQPRNSFFTTQQDHAFTPADNTLLTAVQQEAAAQLGINGASTAQMPVHFSIQNGVVGVTGQVQSLQEKQALIAAIGRTRGVVRVVDDVSIASPGGVNSSAGVENPVINNGNLPATSRGLDQSNSIFLNTTNSSGM